MKEALQKSYKPKIQETLHQLVKVPSTSGQEGKLFGTVNSILANSGVESQVVDGKFVVAHITGGADPSKLMIYHAHGDTVPVDNPDNWKHDPYGAEVVDGKLFGRGATDNKGNAAAVLEMAIHAQELALKGELPCDVMAVIVGMEEKDGSGTDAFAAWFSQQNPQYSHIAALITEPTSMHDAEIGCKGNHFLKLTASGDEGHSTNVSLQDNAVFKLSQCVAGLSNLNTSWGKEYKSEVLGAPQVNPSKKLGELDGEGGYSTVPQSASQIVDLRTSENTHEKALEQLISYVEKFGVAIEHVANPTAPVLANAESNLLKTLGSLIPDLFITSSKATNDLTNLVTTIETLNPSLAEKLEVVVFGAGDEAQEHVDDEYVKISEIEKMFGLMVQLLPLWAEKSAEVPKHPELLKVFGTEQPMIGMVHLLPLPGYPGHPGMEILMQDALEKVHALKDAGFDGALIENDGDTPPYPGKDMERRDIVRDILKQIVRESNMLEMPVGLEILYDDLGTFQVANEAGAKFVRFDVYVDNVETARGAKIDGKADKIQDLKKYLNSDLLIIADVHVKHAHVLDGKTLEESALLASQKGADVISVTGEWTGLQPDLKDLQIVRSAIPENVSVAVGSGATAENVSKLFESGANVILVGSSIKTDGKIDPKKAEAFIKAAKGGEK